MEFKKTFKDTVLDYPQNMILYSKPKIGKTDLISRLPDCGIIDIEGGSEYVTGYTHVVKDPGGDPIKTLKNLDERLDWLIETRPYKYVAFDTMTFMEECSEIEGTYDYMNSSQGKKWNRINADHIALRPELAALEGQTIPHTSILFELVTSLGQGYGYQWTRNNFMKYFNKMKLAADRCIFVCHIKDKFIESKVGDQVSGRELNLTGKLKTMTTSFVDTVGYLHRGKDGNTYISFQAGETVAEGSRRRAVSGRDIMVGKWNKDMQNYEEVYWNEIYPDEKILSYK